MSKAPEKNEEAKSNEPVRFFDGIKNRKDKFVWIPPSYTETLKLANTSGLRRLPNSSNFQIPFLNREANIAKITASAEKEKLAIAERRASGEHLKDRDMNRLKALDETRIPVHELTELGTKAVAGNRSMEVAHTSRSFELNVHEAADMNERFGTKFKEGDRVVYAYDVVPESELDRRKNAEVARAKSREAVLKRDAGRLAILAGASEVGDGIEHGDKSFEIAYIGPEINLSDEEAADMNQRFGTDFSEGDTVVYAYEEVPASVLEARAKEAEEENTPSGP